jgi:hypothetical protein
MINGNGKFGYAKDFFRTSNPMPEKLVIPAIILIVLLCYILYKIDWKKL